MDKEKREYIEIRCKVYGASRKGDLDGDSAHRTLPKATDYINFILPNSLKNKEIKKSKNYLSKNLYKCSFKKDLPAFAEV